MLPRRVCTDGYAGPDSRPPSADPTPRSASSAAHAAASQQPPAEPIHLPTNEESGRLLRIRHTAAHVMAMAVQEEVLTSGSVWRHSLVRSSPIKQRPCLLIKRQELMGMVV